MLKKIKHNLIKTLDRHRARQLIKTGQFAAIDWQAMKALQAQHPKHWAAKYFNTSQFLVRNVTRIYTLHLDAGPKRRILDLGCGFGYFLYAARAMGHQVQGLDLADPLLDGATDILTIPKIHHRIEALQPLPPIPGGPFDLITAFEAVFDRKRGEGFWKIPRWDFFLRDLTRFAADPCELYVKFNQDRTAKRYPVHDDVARYFIDLGGIFDKRAVRLPNLRAVLKK